MPAADHPDLPLSSLSPSSLASFFPVPIDYGGGFPTAGSVLVEVSQLQLLQACHEVTVRTMSPHGESTDSIPAPVAPALAPACQPARMSCLSPRPSPEARTALASVSPGLGDPNFPSGILPSWNSRFPCKPSHGDVQRIPGGTCSLLWSGTLSVWWKAGAS